MKRFALLIPILLFVLQPVKAQELNCQVQVVHQQVQGTNQQLFQTMQKSIFEFMNNRRWTEHVYSNNERIDCSIMINITDYNGSDKFIGTIQVQARRPVYGTSYYTVLLNHKEKDNNFHFEYIQDQSLEFNDNRYISNLTSVLAFYAYVILGMDYDTFSMEGGTPYFQKAQQVINNAQSSSNSGPGWHAYESLDNRYWMVENLLDDNFRPLRRAMYRYHRLGLDVMSERLDNGRSEIAESFRLLQQVHRSKPSSFLMTLFTTAKTDEIINIFSDSSVPMTEKNQVYNIMVEIDPANTQKYEEMKQ